MLACYGRLLQSTDDINSRAQLRTELAALLVDKDPDLLDSMLDLAGKKRKTPGPPRVLELFNGLAAIAKRYETAGIPDDDPAWTDLRGMSERLLATYRHRVDEILPQLDLSGASLRLVPQWLAGIDAALKSMSASEKLPGLLAQSPGFMLGEKGSAQVVDALDELVLSHMEPEAETLAAHLCSALKTSSKEDRIKAVEGLSLLIENSMDQSARIVVQFEAALMDACARETSATVLKPFLTYLFARMVALFDQGYFARAGRHADSLAMLERSFRNARGDEALNPVREAGSELNKSPWTQGLAEYVLEDGEKGTVAAKILVVLGRDPSATLIATIGREENVARAQHFARQMKRLYPGAAKACLAMMTSQNDPVFLARMFAVAPHIGSDDEILEAIYPLLIHSNFDLRATALRFILDRDNDRTSAFVAARMRDPRSAAHRDVWMNILATLRHPAAALAIVAELKAEIDSPNPDDRRTMTLIEACNAHDDARICAVLIRLLRSGLDASDTRPVPAVQRENKKALKLAAMKVLARYAKDPRAYETFEKLRRDSDQDIAHMAALCMNPASEMSTRPPLPSTFAPHNLRAVAVAVSGTGNPLKLGMTEKVSKLRKVFEELEQNAPVNIDKIFQPGATISGKYKRLPQSQPLPQQPQSQAPVSKPHVPPPVDPALPMVFSGKPILLDQSQSLDELVAGLKPLLEGQLHDLGLGVTVRATCATSGVLTIKSSLGEGAIYVQDKIVVAAFFSGMSDIQALAAIDKLKSATFAYYAKSFSYAASMSVEVSKIETAVREYLDKW